MYRPQTRADPVDLKFPTALFGTKTGTFVAAIHCTDKRSSSRTAGANLKRTNSTRTTNSSNTATTIATTTVALKVARTSKTTTTGLTGHARKRSNGSVHGRDIGLGQAAMNLADPGPALYVRALYDYRTDDNTSLSFRKGDVIQVLNQLDTGWWDGVIGDVRGWFPSNYCAVIADPEDLDDQALHLQDGGAVGTSNGGDINAESGAEEDDDGDLQEDRAANFERDGHESGPVFPIESTASISTEQEEAAFWIPQATSDGRLFYFNTLTGYSTMELPLENPLLTSDTGPRDRSNIFVPNQTRPPQELLAQDGDGRNGFNSGSEWGPLIRSSHDSTSRRSRSMSNGGSSVTSMNSFTPSLLITSVPDSKGFQQSTTVIQDTSTAARPSTATSSTSEPLPSFSIPHHFVDEGMSGPVTWSTLVDNMRQAIEDYRQALLNGDRCEYVRRAEDISDHLRMLLAAGSDTTDNHSGNPSIISTNKALYPHFRDMMSRFSKLVLSSHLAAADWPGQDTAAKCFQEAEGVLRAVYGYVEIAKQQRGNNIRRLVPGFLVNSFKGGNWRSNGTGPNGSATTSFLDADGQEPSAEPSVPLDPAILDMVDTLRKSLVVSLRRLDEHLTLTEKIVTIERHGAIGDSVCDAAAKVLELYRPWISTVESLNLAALGTSFQNPQLTDFAVQKQKVYESVADFVLSCQGVSAPLGDEWAELRGDSLEDRLNSVRSTSRQLENYISQVSFSLSLLLEQVPAKPALSVEPKQPANPRTGSDPLKGRTSESGFSVNVEDGNEMVRRKLDKAHRFFGQAPPATIPRDPVREPEETPWFLKFDHEGEVFYDSKADVPMLKCGTLGGLVEQLTRHDKLDASFNNTFLLTYRSFTTASELFEMLVQRFTIQPPYGLNKDELQIWMERKQQPIRFRVVNIFKSWFENFWMEPSDEANMNLLRRVHAFTKDSIATTKTPGSPQLLAVIDKRLKGEDTTTVKKLVPTHNMPAPTPILPKNIKKLKFLDIDAMEFARQLTIIESRIYAKIRPTECLNKTWQKKVNPGEPEPATNVKALILHSNQLTNWVAEMILTHADVKKRVMVIKHFVNVADKCRGLNNFSTLTSIISALATAPIHRLGRTWAQVSGRTSTVLEQMRQLMASTKNFGEYRETLHHANPPCIPFFGVYLTDLTFIEDGIPSHTPSDLINFNKRAKTAEVIRDIQQYQNVPYLLQPVSELQDYVLSNMQASNDVHEMYDRSLEVEPREREDEKIARLLSESGFL